jgi:predicted Ser/Thr protein kinase
MKEAVEEVLKKDLTLKNCQIAKQLNDWYRIKNNQNSSIEIGSSFALLGVGKVLTNAAKNSLYFTRVLSGASKLNLMGIGLSKISLQDSYNQFSRGKLEASTKIGSNPTLEGKHLRTANEIAERRDQFSSMVVLSSASSLGALALTRTIAQTKKEIKLANKQKALQSELDELKTSPSLLDYKVEANPLGKGAAGVVFKGTYQPNAKSHFINPPHWKNQPTEVAVKIARQGDVNQATLKSEATISQEITKHDKHQLFMQYFFDDKNAVLISKYEKDYVDLAKWMSDPQFLKKTTAKKNIENQLKEALATLKRANLVHSDLHPQNILIHPKTGKIKIIDFGIASKPNEFPMARSGLEANKRGGMIRSENQKKDGPAQFSDDEYTINEVLKKLKAAL